VWLVVRESLTLILAGILIGLPLALAAAPLLATQLYGTNPYEPMVLLSAVLALGLSVLIASLIPAFRASLTSPLDALRAE
jgi:ABC-type antimicrobial peptide transport system permease subunit